jgi:hypothetical protein
LLLVKLLSLNAPRLDELEAVTKRLEARQNDLSTEQYQELLQMAVTKEDAMEVKAEADPFADD